MTSESPRGRGGIQIIMAIFEGRIIMRSGGSVALQKPSGAGKKAGFRESVKNDFRKNKGVYLLALPVIVWYAIFMYGPMYGAIIAFKNFVPGEGIWNSPWVGLQNFTEFFKSYYFVRLLANTLMISVYGLIFTFPAPIILALLLNELKHDKFKRVAQTITYIPHFISIVVICGMIIEFTQQGGPIPTIIKFFGGSDQNLLLLPGAFKPIYITSDVWQQIGWGSIIYLAALTSIDLSLYEAAEIDGAGRWKQVWHVTLPCLLPTIVIMLLLRIGQIMNVGFEKIMLLYNSSIYSTADVISTYVYRRGIQQAGYSYASAVGLFNSVVSCLLVVGANKLSKKFTEVGLW